MSKISLYDHYRAYALQAYLSRGFDMDTAIQLSLEVANKIMAEENEEDFSD